MFHGYVEIKKESLLEMEKHELVIFFLSALTKRYKTEGAESVREEAAAFAAKLNEIRK